MPQKEKASAEEKLRIVEKYLSGQVGLTEASRITGVDEATKAHPLFHSDRGFQYTSAVFHQKLRAAGMKQSMSRVAHCIDNGPMEGFWGILKRERYYGYRFTDRTQLMQMITDYIDFYNYHRLQRRLLIMTPMEFHQHFALAA